MRPIIVLFVAAAIYVAAQTPVLSTAWLYAWADGRAVWLRLGPSLVIAGDTLDVRPLPVRRIGVKLPYDDAAKGWKIPAAAFDVELWVNGIHYWPETDYRVNGGVLSAVGANMAPEHDVRASYSEPR